MTPGGQGRGYGNGRNSSGRGRGLGGGRGMGPGGECMCPNCGERVPHKRGEPRFEKKCPKCGGAMTRA